MDNIIPEITAYRLEEAIAILTRSRLKYSVKKITPPFRTENTVVGKDRGEKTGYRVLKQTLQADNVLELVVARGTVCIQS